MKEHVSKNCLARKFVSTYPACIEMDKLEKFRKQYYKPSYFAKQKKCFKALNNLYKKTIKNDISLAKNVKNLYATNPNCIDMVKLDNKWEASTTGKKFKKSFKKCFIVGLTKKNSKPCTLNEYIKYTGAERK